MSRVLATVKVTDKGRIPLPSDVRKVLQVAVGDFVKLYETADGTVKIAKVEVD